MSIIEFDYQVRPEGDEWVVVEFIPGKVSKDVRIIRRTKTKQEAEDLADEDMRSAPFGWALDPAAHGMCEYYTIRPEGDGWAMVEIVWEPTETDVKIVGRTETKEEAEALAAQLVRTQRADTQKLHAIWEAEQQRAMKAQQDREAIIDAQHKQEDDRINRNNLDTSSMDEYEAGVCKVLAEQYHWPNIYLTGRKRPLVMSTYIESYFQRGLGIETAAEYVDFFGGLRARK